MNETFSHRNLLSNIVIFIFYPFGAFVKSIMNFRLKESKIIFVLFSVLYGYTFVTYTDTMDAFRYADYFEQYCSMNVSQFVEMMSKFGQEGMTDLYCSVTLFLVSRITANVHIVFALWAGIYALFFVKFISLIIKILPPHINKYTWLFFIGIALLIPYWSINGVRMWTAFFVYFYAAMKIVLCDRNKSFFVAFVAILIHFSYVLPVLFLGIYIVAKNRKVVLLSILILAIIYSANSTIVIRNISANLGEGVEYKMYGYTDKEYIAERNEIFTEQIWYAKYRQDILNYYIIGSLALSFVFLRKEIANKRLLDNTFSFTILMWSLANYVSSVGSGSRFLLFFHLSALCYLLLLSIHFKNHKIVKTISILGVIPILLFITVGNYSGKGTIDPLLFINPIITSFLLGI